MRLQFLFVLVYLSLSRSLRLPNLIQRKDEIQYTFVYNTNKNINKFVKAFIKKLKSSILIFEIFLLHQSNKYCTFLRC